MSTFTFTVLLVFLGALCSLIRLRYKAFLNGKNGQRFPPGPRGLPIIGNLHELGNLPHRNLHDLAKVHGPIMLIRLGNVPTVVVTSPEAAELVLKTHDTVFANRPHDQATKYMVYGGPKGILSSPYGPYWRNLRKFVIHELLSQAKMDSFRGMRWEVIRQWLQSLKEAAAANEVVDLSEKMGELIEDMMYTMLFRRTKDERFDIKSVTKEAMQLLSSFNLADYFPIFRHFDIQGLTKRMKATAKAMDEILETIIQDHEQDQNQNREIDIVDVILQLEKQSESTNISYDRTDVKAVLINLISGSIDTSLSTTNWVISELIRHPRVMKKLQEELNNVVGLNRLVEEKDLPKLEYLDMVIKETFRLHPAAPFIFPRETSEDITINGYYIPRKSRVFVNAWAIARDPRIWSNNAEEFLPERFLGSNLGYRGLEFCFLPFGSGRRVCPGITLGLTTVQLVVAHLVHCFNLKLPNNMSPGDLDMEEKYGLVLLRANHLFAVPSYRLQTANVQI